LAYLPEEEWCAWATYPLFFDGEHAMGGNPLGWYGIQQMFPGTARDDTERQSQQLAHARAVRWVLLDFLAGDAAGIETAPALNWRPEPRNITPCPYCGEPLRTAAAKQCRHCKMDWHDPERIVRRAPEADGL
jgi:hypothetical protein